MARQESPRRALPGLFSTVVPWSPSHASGPTRAMEQRLASVVLPPLGRQHHVTECERVALHPTPCAPQRVVRERYARTRWRRGWVYVPARGRSGRDAALLSRPCNCRYATVLPFCQFPARVLRLTIFEPKGMFSLLVFPRRDEIELGSATSGLDALLPELSEPRDDHYPSARRRR